ncbi:MAG: hypothetical protein N3B16_12275 [Candidatus Aminicenantes bacterium]|nr:hypothetical protein [Candidatus Aminicenantes bacterium]
MVKASKVQFFIFDHIGTFLKNCGLQPDFFIFPKRNKDFDEMIKWGRAQQGREAAGRWYCSSSWVCGLFSLRKFVGILIKSFNINEKKWNCWIQLYNLDGEVIEKGIKLAEPGSHVTEEFYIESDKLNNIYILENTNGILPRYIIYHYSIEL